MIRFDCDYTEGAMPEVLERLCATNLEQTPAYGNDAYCDAARAAIRRLCGAPDADVHFLVGGTQTNATFLSAALRPWQAVLTAETGHINIHESGAIEATGHKCIALPTQDGRLDAAQLEAYLTAFADDPTREHMVQPGAVYLSFPTETGMIYQKDALAAVSAVCHRHGLLLYCDGARLGYGLAAPDNDLTLADFAALCDAFYIGGTKVGLLFGEALVLCNPALFPCFRTHVKQHGAMLAKGRLLGVQFAAALEDDRYFRVARRAVGYALELRDACRAKGYAFLYPSTTNQQLVVFPDEAFRTLSASFVLDHWGKPDAAHTAARICTSWATTRAQTDALLAAIRAL